MSGMSGVLPDQLPWWIAGPGVGLCVVALYGLANAKLGVSGGWLQLVLLAQRRSVTEGWRLWFNGGLGGGGVLPAWARRGVGGPRGGGPSHPLSSVPRRPVL